MEPKVGGDLFEISKTGERCVWGRVTVFERPGRVQFTWFPGRTEATGQIVDVTFRAAGARQTQVDLEHSNWQTLGDQAAEMRSGYERGWTAVLDHFKAAAAR
jgi:uncharacterized protein YndB with AHSA1/START domain